MKTKLFFASIFILIFAFSINAQDSRDMNLNIYMDGKVANVPTFIDNSALSTATYTTLTASPHAVSRSCAVYFKRNDTAYIYQFGGGAGAQFTNVARYNITTATWTNNVSTMPGNMSAASAISYGDSVIFVFGGESAGGLGRCFKWNVVTNTWTTMAPMPTSPCTDQATFKYRDTLVYCVGGGDGLFGAVVFADTRIYNMKQNTWTSGTSLPVPKSMLTGAIYNDTMIVSAGWGSGSLATNLVHKGIINPANPTTITWTTIANYPAGAMTRSAGGLIVKGGGVGVVISGGAVDGATVSNLTRFWNFCTQSWESMPNNSLARSNYKGGAADSSMWAPGGFTTVGVGQFDRITFQTVDGTCGQPVGINTNQNGIPFGYALQQNYPNPFNPTTTISFGLPVSGIAKIVVTDILGREVAVIANEFRTAGVHNIDFDASKLTSGIYFYTLTANDYKETKKMLLIK